MESPYLYNFLLFTELYRKKELDQTQTLSSNLFLQKKKKKEKKIVSKTQFIVGRQLTKEFEKEIQRR